MYWRGWNVPALGSSWREMERLQSEMNRLFQDARGWPQSTDYPAINAWVGEDDTVVTAELPGIDPESLDISVVDDILTLKGMHPEEDLPENAQVHRRERGSGEFTRTLTLPYRVDSDKVEANYTRGVLRIRLPRAEADKPRKIEVKAD